MQFEDTNHPKTYDHRQWPNNHITFFSPLYCVLQPFNIISFVRKFWHFICISGILQQSILSRNQNISNQFDSLIKADSLGLLETVWFQRKYAKVHIWHTGILSLEQSIILEIEKKNVSHPSRKKQASAVSLFQLIVGIFTGETTSVTFKLPVNQTSSKMEVYSEQRGFTPRAPRAIFF